MAKLALINRDNKRRKTVAKFAARRAELVEIINDSKRSDEERVEARIRLQQLPRDSSPSGCATAANLPVGRAVYSASSVWAQQAARDRDAREIPGIIKASW